MKTPENFSTRNLNILNFENYRVEQLKLEREKNKRNITILLFIAVIPVFLMVNYQWYILGGIVLFLEFIAYVILNYYVKATYKKEFKNNILTRLVKSIDDSFDYYPDRSVTLSEFKESNFTKAGNRCTGEDFFKGRIVDTLFHGSEIKIETHSGKHSHVDFQGLFFIIEYAIPENAKIEILPDFAERAFGKFGNFLQSANLIRSDLIKFNQEQFEQIFVAYSNNEKVARNVISEKLMLKLLEINKHFNGHVYLTFNNNRTFFGINNKNDIFKVNIKDSLLENNLMNQYFQQFYQYIDAITQILECLKAGK